MKGKVIGITGLFLLIIVAITFVCCATNKMHQLDDAKAEALVLTNEVEQLFLQGDSQGATEQMAHLKETIRDIDMQMHNQYSLILLGGIGALFVFIVFGYIYFAIIRPFDKMKIYASEIAKGNFDMPLRYERSNYFGEFTWAFDSMRLEIIKARSCEKEAIENNKTVIATLSHDIKTPIASIRAYAEGLEANMDTTPEKRAKYLSVMMRKCDEVSNLTQDLFLHSLSDLDKLKINPEVMEVCGFLRETIEEIGAEHGDVEFDEPKFTALVMADKNRLLQMVENIINNGRKYAKTNIQVHMEKKEGNVELHFRDYGPGIPDEDIPFIFDKFYRGKNCGTEQGSGLGLYIVKYLAEKMDGSVRLWNHEDGLQVTIIFPEKN